MYRELCIQERGFCFKLISLKLDLPCCNVLQGHI